jgi:hypothetical protein
MRFIKYAAIGTLFVCGFSAYGDFHVIREITYTGEMVRPIPWWRESLEKEYKAEFPAVDAYNVRVASQDLKINFLRNDTVEVYSEYVLEVFDDEVAVDVQYFFSSVYYVTEGEKRLVQGIDDFDVELGGTPISREDILFLAVDPEEGGEAGKYTAIFSLVFDKAGKYAVKLSYSQEIPGGILGVKDAASEHGQTYGFVYDIGPLKYWAGDVGTIRVEVVIEGFDLIDFGFVAPPDFTTTDEGYRWEWHDVTDDTLSEGLKVELYVG